MTRRVVRSTIWVQDLIGIFVHAAAVLRWPAGTVQLTTPNAPMPDLAPKEQS